jgi:hypothetical protein
MVMDFPRLTVSGPTDSRSSSPASATGAETAIFDRHPSKNIRLCATSDGPALSSSVGFPKIASWDS